MFRRVRKPTPAVPFSVFSRPFVAHSGVPPVNRRVFIQTVQQADGSKDLPKRTAFVVPAA